MKSSLVTAEVDIKVPFHDVDLMAVAWHGHYLKYFEIARCALLDKIDYNYPQMRDSGYMWPVIDVRVRYIKPARFGQKLKVSAFLVEIENRLKIEYVIRDADSQQRLSKGYTVQVAVTEDSQEMLLASPPVLFQKLGIERCE
jgi:acyl-CoA thioester hydrolase